MSDDRMDETAALFSDAAVRLLPGRCRQAFAEASLSACPDRVRETVFSA